MKLTVKLDFGCGREIKVGTFSEIGRDTAFEFAGEFLSSGLDPAPFRLRADGGLKIYDRSGNMETFGLFDDSLPDGWGRRIVKRCLFPVKARTRALTIFVVLPRMSGSTGTKANQSWIASLKAVATLFSTEFLDRTGL